MVKQQSCQWVAIFNILIIISTTIPLLLSGCAHTVTLGQKRTVVGTLKVSSSFDLAVNKYNLEIMVSGDENGNSILTAENNSGSITLILSPSDNKEVIRMLNKSLELGSIIDKKQAGGQVPLGHLRTQVGEYGWPTDLMIQFHPSKEDRTWNASCDLCLVKPEQFRSGLKVKTSACEKEMAFILTKESVTRLINFLSLTSDYAQDVKATAGNDEAKVNFSPPASNGGSAITGYTVTSNPPGGTDSNAGSTKLSHTVTGLTNGTAYTFSVQVANVAGTGPASASSNSVTPLSVPGAPMNVTVTAGNAGAKVTFTPPASNGGSAITGYTVTSNPPGGTDSNAGSTELSHTITGLTNGTAYTFSVQAANVTGAGPVSAKSNSVTPFNANGLPSNVTAIAGNTEAKVTFSPPASNGGRAITGYTVTSNPPGGTDSNAGSTELSHTVTGLTNGTAYTFSVQAANVAGTGPASASSNNVTPLTAPGAPMNVTAAAGNVLADVTFSPPASNGGRAITGYTVTSNPPGGTDSNAGSTKLSHTVTGLTNGTAYTFSVQAANVAGTGPVSASSNSVTPLTVPGAPMNVAATAGNVLANVTFSPPASNGGSAITGYTVTSNPPGGTDSNAGSTELSHTIAGLTNGTAYTFSVEAANVAGTGPASAASQKVMPFTVPRAPTSVTAISGIALAKVTFSPPASDGGSAITGYTVTSNPPGGTDINAGSTELSHTISGLATGRDYTFTVQAANIAGTGPASATSDEVRLQAVPGAPTNVIAKLDEGSVVVTFSPPALDGGSHTTSYTVTSNPPDGNDVDARSTELSHTIIGLTTGIVYTFTVQASNIFGNGPASAPSNSVTR